LLYPFCTLLDMYPDWIWIQKGHNGM
jgi:hypothetical protein